MIDIYILTLDFICLVSGQIDRWMRLSEVSHHHVSIDHIWVANMSGGLQSVLS